MKKTYIFALSLAVAMLGACTDDLNQYPHTQTSSDEVYSDAGNYISVLAKLYASFVIAGQESGGGDEDISSNTGYDTMRGYFNLQEAATDEVAATWLSGDDMTDITYMTWDANDPWVADVYYRLYYTITLCNEFLSHTGESDVAGFTTAEQEEIATYAAEARFLRALAYYMVLDLYGQGPFVDETMSVGAYTPEAYTNAQLFDYIESELTAIEDELTTRTECVYGHAPQGAAWALLAKLYLNAEVYDAGDHYTDCITYCKKIIDGGYTLEEDYYKLFNADNDQRTNEIIFAFVVDATNTVSWGSTTYIVCGECGNSSTQDPADYGIDTGWGMFRVRGELPDLWDDVETSGDARCMFYTDSQEQWLDSAIDDQSLGYFGEKYSNLTDDGEQASATASYGACIDQPMFRLGDVYLMAAEAVLRGGSGYSKSEALDLCNALRERAYGDTSGNITEAQLTLSYIIDERARELWWECTRRTDLIRFGLFTGGDYLWQWKGGISSGTSVSSKYDIYPIPTAELSANPNLSNPNY